MDSNTKSDFFKVLSFIKPVIGRYVFGLLGGAATGAAASIMTAFVIKDLLDAATSKNKMLLLYALDKIFIVVLVLCIFAPIFNYIFKSCVKRTMADIRLKVFRHIEELGVGYFEDVHSGDTISRMTNDVKIMEDVFSDDFYIIIHTVLSGLGSAAFMFVFDWRTALIMISLGLLSTFANSRFSKPIRAISDRIQENLALLAERLSDIINGFNVIKMFHIHDIIAGKFDEANDNIAKASMKRVHIGALQDGANFLLGWLNFGGIMLLGSLMALFGSISFGKLAANIQLLNGVTFMFLQIGSFMAQIQASLAGASRVLELLQIPTETEGCNKVNMADYSGSSMVELKNVVFSYEEGNRVLDGLSLKVEKGQTAALVGPSGGGKSTVIKLLMGFYPPGSGEMVICGKPLSDYTLEELRSLISYVPQDAYLFDGTIEDNIRYGRPDAGEDDIIAAAKGAFAHGFILEQPEGYNTVVGERGTRLSGGQRQRIAIARAILKNAPILLLDEATSALDSESEQEVQNALEVLMKDRTVIVVAHRLSTIENADIIYVVDEGKIIEQGTHGELKGGGGLYRKLYELTSKDVDVAS